MSRKSFGNSAGNSRAAGRGITRVPRNLSNNYRDKSCLVVTFLSPGGGPINLRTVEPDTASGSVRDF